MKLVLHDLKREEFAGLFPEWTEEAVVVKEEGEISRCVGCFGCWLKTPGTCVIRDGYGDYGPILGKCTEYILLSRVVYGGFSPFVKNVLDRNIGYLLPFFETRNGEMHHASRYPGKVRLTALGYGEDVTAQEQKTFRSIVAANAQNLNVKEYRVLFAETPEQLARRKEELL